MNNLTNHSFSYWSADLLEEVSACPICGSQNTNTIYADLTDRAYNCADGIWKLERCLSCLSLYLNPRPTSASIGKVYEGYGLHTTSPAVDTASPSTMKNLYLSLRNTYLNKRYNMNLKPEKGIGAFAVPLIPMLKYRFDSFVRHIRIPAPSSRLLDLGCGNGYFVARMLSVGWAAEGLEPAEDGVNSARKVGLNVQQGILTETTFADNSFDAITMAHVIEHLHDPISTLRICHRILKPGGFLWIATPNLSSIGHQQFGRNWLHLDPPRHLVLFTPDSLRLALKKAGFTETALMPYFGSAKMVYDASVSVAHQDTLVNTVDSLPNHVKWRTMLADLRAWGDARLGEEQVVLTQKM